MYLYTCQPCLEGHHEHCHGTQLPPKGQFGGSKCDCNCKKPEPIPALNISATPRTDAHINKNVSTHGHAIVCHDFARTLEREIQSLRNEIAHLNGQTRFYCQCGGVKAAPASIPTPTPKAMENIIRDFLKSNGWASVASTLPDGTRQGVYKSPTTGRYYSMVYALLSALDKYRTA